MTPSTLTQAQSRRGTYSKRAATLTLDVDLLIRLDRLVDAGYAASRSALVSRICAEHPLLVQLPSRDIQP